MRLNIQSMPVSDMTKYTVKYTKQEELHWIQHTDKFLQQNSIRFLIAFNFCLSSFYPYGIEILIASAKKCSISRFLFNMSMSNSLISSKLNLFEISSTFLERSLKRFILRSHFFVITMNIILWLFYSIPP